MGDSLITVVVIVLAAGLMLVFPLMTMSERTDDISQLVISTETTEFVDDVRTTGKLTLDNYEKFLENINSTGNAYEVEMQIGVLDENPGKKTTQATNTKIGENVRFEKYTSQIEEELDSKRYITLKEGDIFSVSVKNTSQTLSQQLNNFLYTVSGNDSYIIAAQHAGIVTVNGK